MSPEALSQGERRIVTVLFADVSGFTAMSETLDPEDVRDIMNRCFGRLSEVVYAHEGFVDKYVGDNLMALFGVPRAREDDALRAVAAALAMQAALGDFSAELSKEHGLSVAMRIGINTGLVVAGEVGSSQKSSFTVMGDVVNTASRIEHSAEPGKVWISSETHRFVSGRFLCRKLRPVTVKGKAHKLQLFEVVSERREEDREASSVLRPAFVGREKEAEALAAALKGALAGECHVVSLSGDAGLGKSQLLRRFLKSAQDGTPGLRVFHVACPPQGSGAYGVFTEIARRHMDPAELPGESDPQWKDKFFLAFERWLMGQAGAAPILLALEDLHFADAGSWEQLSFLVSRLRSLRAMVLCLFRPVAERNIYWSSAENYVHIHLKPFPAKTALGMLDKCLGKNRLPETLKEELVRKAGGNPYFLTELLWTLAETGQLVRKSGAWALGADRVSLRIPDTVQAALLVRLDGLPPKEKELLQGASVVGMKVPAGLLERLLPHCGQLRANMEDLVTRRFLVKPAPSEEGAQVYEFMHVLLQEVCYESLLKSKREALHLAVAAAYESGAPAEGEAERTKLIADHYFRTKDAAKALQYQLEVARRAAGRYAVGQGIEYYRRCLEILDHAGPSGVPGGVSRGQVLYPLGELYLPANDLQAALACFQGCLEHLGPEDPLQFAAFRKLHRVFSILGEEESAREVFHKVQEALSRFPERDRLRFYYETAAYFFQRGEDDRALEWIGKLSECARKVGLEVSLPESGDVHELLPAFSFLATSG